jgi:hypothetical protein
MIGDYMSWRKTNKGIHNWRTKGLSKKEVIKMFYYYISNANYIEGFTIGHITYMLGFKAPIIFRYLLLKEMLIGNIYFSKTYRKNNTK